MKPIFALLVLLAACGTHSPLDPGAGNNLGTGTGTLTVTGSATGRGRISNAHQPSDFDTDFSVRVQLAMQTITTGTVTITSAHTKLNLTFNPNGGGGGGGGGGRWEGTANGYDEVYQLDVVSGPDKVEAVRVDGPDIHSFTAPTAGASMDSRIANTVTWARIETADTARFRDDAGDLTIPDTGTYSIAPGSLKTDQTQAHPNTLQLTRTDRVTPAGAAGGSEFTVSVVNDIDVVALPCPGC
jgi:hypothetical protein